MGGGRVSEERFGGVWGGGGFYFGGWGGGSVYRSVTDSETGSEEMISSSESSESDAQERRGKLYVSGDFSLRV